MSAAEESDRPAPSRPQERVPEEASPFSRPELEEIERGLRPEGTDGRGE
jgi:hypothetical protein